MADWECVGRMAQHSGRVGAMELLEGCVATGSADDSTLWLRLLACVDVCMPGGSASWVDVLLVWFGLVWFWTTGIRIWSMDVWSCKQTLLGHTDSVDTLKDPRMFRHRFGLVFSTFTIAAQVLALVKAREFLVSGSSDQVRSIFYSNLNRWLVYLEK